LWLNGLIPHKKIVRFSDKKIDGPAAFFPMKPARYLLLILVLISTAAWAGEPEFPGLKAIMSEADWKRAKLDRLDAEDVRLINEAFAQYLKTGTSQPSAPVAASAAVSVPVSEATPPPAKKSSLWERFGLGKAAEQKPVEPVVMHATATAWHGANGFVLDNGQVWQGIDPIRDELVGHDVGIRAGKLGSFLLLVDGEETNVRVHRLK
jgi:hypothetical protein